ncbi:hypothetical protein FBU31_000602 [Coemansia sp. 'formosensis']|nr:hypothetical protein FBU31_000602 [Coemansia sp. 'formosensis']
MTALADINIEELHTLKRKQLQSLCKKHGVKANGKSEEIIERLIEHINKGGSDNASDSGDGGSDDDDDDDDQRYDSAAEEVKSSTLPSDGDQIATPEKLFKVVPLLKPAEMDAPESITVVDQAQFTSQVEKFTAQLEARAAAMAAQMGNDDIEKYNPAYGLVVKTPRSKNATKTISFDKAHEKLFSSDDSIANHWSAKKVTTPGNKRTNDSVLDSNKRPRIEALFGSPSVQPQSARAKRKSTKVKSMTVKTQRTAAPGASLDGSKTVAADSRVKLASDIAALSPATLFSGVSLATPEPQTATVGFAPLVDAASSMEGASEPASTIFSPKKSRPAKNGDAVVLMSPAKSASKAKTPATPSKTTATPKRAVVTPAKPVATPKKATATPSKTAATLKKTAATPAKHVATPTVAAPTPLVATAVVPAVAAAAAAVEVDKSKPVASAVVPKAESTLPKAKPDAAAPTKPITQKESAAPVSKPSQIPMARKIAKPRSIAASVVPTAAPKKAAFESKIQAPKKPEVVKLAPKQAATKPNSAPAPASVPAPATTASATTKPLATQPAGFRNVESKVKSYINSKPPQPKVNAVKLSKPDPKNTLKPVLATAKPAKSVPAPAASTAPKDSASKDIPNYMKSTRAKEIRSQQVVAKAKPKSGPGKPAKTDDGKARFNPYNRPAKPVVAKPSAAK